MKTPGALFRMYVYILKCSDDNYYVGITNNLERRINEHQLGINESCYTFKRRPLVLVYHQGFLSIVKAIEVEKRIKKWSKKKNEAFIQGDYNLLQELSKKKFYRNK